MHKYDESWQEILKTHCDDEGRMRLNYPTPKEKFVCFRHFEGDKHQPISGRKDGLNRLRKSFCGHTYTGDQKVKQKVHKLLKRVSGSESVVPATKKPYLGENETLEHNEHSENTTIGEQESNLIERNMALYTEFKREMDDFTASQGRKYGSGFDSFINYYLTDSVMWQNAVMQVLFLLVKFYVDKLKNFDPRRPITKALIRTLDIIGARVSDKEIHLSTGIGRVTLHESRLELDDEETLIDGVIEGDEPIFQKEENSEDDDKDEDYDSEGSEEEDVPRKRVKPKRHSPSNRMLPMSKENRVLLDWCTDNAPVKSGSRDLRKLRFSTYDAAFKRYKSDMEDEGKTPYHFAQFHSLLYRWAISPQHYDKYACPICYALFSTAKSIRGIEDDEHMIRKSLISDRYAQQVDEISAIRANFIIIIMDYSRVHELTHSQCKELKENKLSILSFVVILPGG